MPKQKNKTDILMLLLQKEGLLKGKKHQEIMSKIISEQSAERLLKIYTEEAVSNLAKKQ